MTTATDAQTDERLTGAKTGAARPRGELVLRNIHKAFQSSGALALDDVSCTIEPGEFLVIVGPSGCGKSTMLNIAAGMIRPDQGEVVLDGKPVRAPGPDRAVVFQEHALFPWLSAEENVGFGLKMSGMRAGARRERVHEVLKMVHLSNSAGKLIHELSGGMRQRVAIARAMVMDPAVLLMDEPFASLDAQTRTLLQQQLQLLRAQTRKSILFVTHSVGEAVRLADRIIVLHAHPGRVRRIIRVQLQHPRPFDSADINELTRIVRKEIEDEVNRVNTVAADAWRPGAIPDLATTSDDMGSGI